MATEIDKRVVEMQFDNKDFEKNCKESLTTLEKLKMALNFDGVKGLESMGKAASKVDLSNIGKGADAVSVKLSAMQIAGMTAIQELTRGLMNFGKNVWANTFGQIKTGGWARTLKIDQANFQMKALAENLEAVKKGTIDVTQYMNKMGESIDKAVTGTAYGYDAAASVASQLMASNITDVDTMYNHLRAIAGAASMTGRSFEDIGNIFTTVASNGRLMTMQLRQFSASGLNLSATLAQQLGKTESQINEMVTKGKISFEQFSDALYAAFGEAAGKADETWSGVTSNVKAQLSRIGQLFTDPMVKNLIPVLAEVKAKLKEVKAALEPVAKTWTKFFEYVTDKAKIFIKNLNGSNIKPVIHSIENVLVALIEIIWTVGSAIKEVFGSDTINDVKQGVSSLEMFTRTLIPTKKSLEDFKQIIKAILVPFRLLWTIGVSVLKYAIGPLLNVFVTFLSVLVKIGKVIKPIVDEFVKFASDGEFLASVLQIIMGTLLTLSDILITILDCVVELLAKLTESGTFQLILSFLSAVGNLLAKVITVALTVIFGLINDILTIINPSRIEAFFDVIISAVELVLGILLSAYEIFASWLDKMAQGDTIFGKILQFLSETWQLIKNIFGGRDISNNLNNLQVILSQLADKIKAAWERFTAFMHDMDAGKIIVYAFSIAMILLVLSIQGLFNALTGMVNSVTTGVKTLVSIFDDIRGFLQGMLKMTPALQVILGLIGLLWSLTACLVILSDLEWDELARAGIALGSFGAGLLIMVLVLSKIKFAGFGTALTILPAILGLALAICASAAAISMLAKANVTLKQLIPALVSVALLLGLLAGAIVLIQFTAAEINTIIKKNMAAESKKVMVSAGVIVAFAAAVGVLTICLYKLSDLPFKDAMAGLAAVAGLMGALAVSMAIINWSGAKFGSALGIALFISSFIILLKSIVKLSELPFEKMLYGLKNAGSVLSAIAIFFTVTSLIGKLGGNVMIHNITEMFFSLAVLIGITTATIFLLKSMNQEAVSRGIGVVILISMLFTAVVKHLLKSLNSFAGNMKTYKDASILKSFGKFIATFSVCLIALVAAAMVAKKINFLDIVKIAGIMAAFTTAVIFLEKFSAHTKRAKLGVIITFMAGIVMMFSMLALLTLTDPDHLMAATLGVVGVILALSVLAFAVGVTSERIEKAAKESKESKFKNVALFVAFVMGIIGIIAILIPLVNVAKEAESYKLEAAALAVVAVMVTVIVAVGVLAAIADKMEKPDTLPKLIGPIIAICASMILVVKSITDLLSSIYDSDQAIFAVGVAIAVLLTFFEVMRIFEDLMTQFNNTGLSDKDVKALGFAALMMGSVFAIIAGSIAVMTYVMNGGVGSIINSVASWGMLILGFLAIAEEFKSLIDLMNRNKLTSGDMLKVSTSVVIMSSVLAIIAASVVGLAVAMHYVGSLNVLGSWGMILTAFTLIVYALAGLCEHIEQTKLTSTDMLKVAASAVIMSSVLAIIAGCITTMTMIISTSPAAIVTSILAFIEILGGLAILLIAFKEFLDESKGVDTMRMLAVAGIIDLVSLSLVIISGSIAMLTKVGSGSPDAWASMIAGWVLILSSFGVVCVALYKMGQKIDPGKTASAAFSVVIASGAFLIISKAIAMLNDLNVDDDFITKMGALIVPFGIIIALMAIIAAVGNEVNPLSMLAASASIVIGATALLIIGKAMQKAVNAFKGVNETDINRLRSMVNDILLLLGVITVAGGLLGAAGGMVGAAAIAGIAALMAAFILFASGVKILAEAVNTFVEAVLKINNVKVDYTTVYRNIKNGIQGACDAIVDSRPNMLEALNALFSTFLAAVSSVVGTVVALGIAFFLAFMDGILQALPEALRILSTIMKIIVDWLEEPGNLELFRSFFRDIGAMLVEVILGAFEGLMYEIDKWIDNKRDEINKIKNEQASQRFTEEANSKMFDKAFNKSLGTDNDMYYYLQNMMDNQEFLNRFEEGTEDYERAYDRFAKSRERVHENLEKMTYQDWVNTIDFLNKYAENVKNAGGVLDDEFLSTVQYLQHVAPIEFRDDFNDAVLGVEPAVQELTNEVTVLNNELSAGPNVEGIQHLEGEIEGASDSMTGLADSAEFVKEKMQETGFDSAKAIDYMKEKASTFSEGFKNSLSNVDIKGLAKKWGVSSTKVGSWLGKITGISFGEEYEESIDNYILEGNELILNDVGEYVPRYQAMGYESGQAYAEAMMEGADDGTTYGLKRLAEFLGINLDIEDAMQDTIGSFEDFSSGLESIGNSADKTKSKLEDFRDGLKESMTQALKGIFDEVSEQEYIDPEEMLYRMEENTRRVGEWARNIATLAARGMSEGLLNELKDMGPAGAAKVQAFVDMTDEQLRRANQRWQAADHLPDYGTKEIEKAYKEAGFNASLGFAEGIDATAANDAMSALSDEALKTLKNKDNLYIQSPSKTMEKLGNYATEGLAIGLTDERAQSVLKVHVNALASMILNSLNNNMKPQKFQQVGSNMMQGFSNGVSFSIPQILSKINAFCAQIINAFQRVLRMHSPSKVMEELGEYTMDGFGIGFEDGAENVEKMSDQAANDILNQMKANIAAITNGWSEDNAYQPVIRPVFDMEAINQGYTDIQSWFANSPGLSLNGNLSRLTPTTSEDSDNNQMLIDAIKSINNDDVVDELSALRNDISNLQTAMTNLQVVMNTGALVGQILEPIDSALGAKALRNSRGRY